MDSRDLDIFISAHKDFEQCVSNSCYKIITGTDAAFNTTLDIICEDAVDITPREFSYAEGLHLYYLWKKYPLKKYVGLCHYRSYFSFMDDIPDMDDIFRRYKVITAEKTKLDWTVAEHYDRYHIIDTLLEIKNILGEKYPQLIIPFENFLNQNQLIVRNMFIMRRGDFCKYADFVFDILLEYDKRHSFVTSQDVRNYVETFPQHVGNSFYQSRLEGFLLERLTSFYLMYFYNELERLSCPVITTLERTYWIEKKD